MTMKFKHDPLRDVAIWGVRKLLTCFKDASLSMKLANVAKTDRRYTITATIHATIRAIWGRETKTGHSGLWIWTTYTELKHTLLFSSYIKFRRSDVESKPSQFLSLLLFSCLVLFNSCDLRDWSPPGSSVHGISQARRLGCHFLLQVIFLTQGSNPHLLLGRRILYRWATTEAPSPYWWYKRQELKTRKVKRLEVRSMVAAE